MTRILCVVGLVIALSGCAGRGSEHYVRLVDKEVGRLQEPWEPLSSYGSFELQPMVRDELTRKRPEKMRVADEIERLMQATLEPLLAEWNGQSQGPGKGMLHVTPKLQYLHVVGAGTRFWVGGGDSRVDMDLVLTEVATGRIVARPRIVLTASAQSGAWTVGATDQNMLNYLADISYEYLKRNY